MTGWVGVEGVGGAVVWRSIRIGSTLITPPWPGLIKGFLMVGDESGGVVLESTGLAFVVGDRVLIFMEAAGGGGFV